MTPPPLDDTISPGQAGHITDHEYIADQINDNLAFTSTGAAQSVRRDWFQWTKATQFHVDGASGSTTDTKIANTLSQAGSYAISAGGADVLFGDGDYQAAQFSVPHQVSVLGKGPNRTKITNTATNNSSLIYHFGSRITIAGLTIDGKRSAQPGSAGNALQITKPNGTTGGSTSLSGGLLLTSGPSAGATSIAVSVATVTANGRTVPVQPGDVIRFNNGTNFEVARVARTYTGGTTIPLEHPLQFSWTTGAWVTFACTDINVEDCDILAVGFISLSLFNVVNFRLSNLGVYDAIDTALDIEGGCSDGSVLACRFETNGRWGTVVDTYDDKYGVPTRITYTDCHARVLNGGVDPASLGVAFTGFDIHGSDGVTIRGGSTDIRLAGIGGVRRRSGSTTAAAKNFVIDGHRVIGPAGGRSGTCGYQSIIQDTANPDDSIIRNMRISDVAIGIQFDIDRAGLAVGNNIRNVDHGINMNAGAGVAQLIRSRDNTVENCVTGVRGGGTAVSGSRLYSRGDVVRNASFAAQTGDTNWTVDTADAS